MSFGVVWKRVHLFFHGSQKFIFQPRVGRCLLHCRVVISSTTNKQIVAQSHCIDGLLPRQSNVVAARYYSSQLAKDDETDDTDESNNDPLSHHYMELVRQREVEADPVQLDALRALERLWRELSTRTPAEQSSNSHSPPQHSTPQTSFSQTLASWFSFLQNPTQPSQHSTATSGIKGVYLHGGVGCGKTFLMTLFHDFFDHHNSNTNANLKLWKRERQKIHFHKFMLAIHQLMHEARYQMPSNKNNTLENDQPGLHYLHHHDHTNVSLHQNNDDMLTIVIDQVLQKGRLICLDDFQVTDVADALILKRLFTGLWERGAILVATSNRPPSDLYLNGIQRDRFLPFITDLQQHCEVVSLWNSETDYRLTQKILSGESMVQFDAKSHASFDRLFYELCEHCAISPTQLATRSGRRVFIPQAALAKRIARFHFEDLCQKALGPADYLLIGQEFHTVFVDQIPVMTINEVNWMRRFITFVDSMYESNVKLVLQSQVGITELVQKTSDNTSHDELFAFDRTVSRLHEMSSKQYLQKRWSGTSRPATGAADTTTSAAHNKVVETTVDLHPSVGDSTVHTRSI